MRLTPLIVARAQLLTAIELFFGEKDPISVQALAGNAREILEKLCRQAHIQPMTEFLFKDHPDKSKKEIYDAINLYRNCFKHLGDTEEIRQEDQRTLDQFDDSKNEYLLFICVEDYIRLRKAMPVPMQVFHAWFCASHIDLLEPQHPVEDRYGRKAHLDLYIYCREKKTDLVILFGGHFMSSLGQGGTVTFRVDKKPAIQKSLTVSNDHSALGLWGGANSIPFIKSLFGASTLFVRATPHSHSSVSSEFNISGLQEAIVPLRRACGWPT
jgi:hypothetical protein